MIVFFNLDRSKQKKITHDQGKSFQMLVSNPRKAYFELEFLPFCRNHAKFKECDLIYYGKIIRRLIFKQEVKLAKTLQKSWLKFSKACC